MLGVFGWMHESPPTDCAVNGLLARAWQGRAQRPLGAALAPHKALELKAGDVVLSHRVSSAVPSALRGLTTVFGMGTGVTLAAKPPTKRETMRFGELGEWEISHPAHPVHPCLKVTSLGFGKMLNRATRCAVQ